MNKDEIIEKICKSKKENYKNCMKKSLNHYCIDHNNNIDDDHSITYTKEILDSFYKGKISQKLLNSKYYK